MFFQINNKAVTFTLSQKAVALNKVAYYDHVVATFKKQLFLILLEEFEKNISLPDTVNYEGLYIRTESIINALDIADMVNLFAEKYDLEIDPGNAEGKKMRFLHNIKGMLDDKLSGR